jgi:hypothetical protein
VQAKAHVIKVPLLKQKIMKLLNWIGHPVVLVVVYLLLVIEGDNFGGYFAVYLILALPHGALYAMFSAIGIGLIVYGFNLAKEPKQAWLKSGCYIMGFVLMVLGLCVFFSKGNKWETFESLLPLTTFSFFGITSVCFLINLTISLSKKLAR